MPTPHCLHNTSQNKKKPGSQEATGRLLHFERASARPLFDDLPPIKRVWPGPGVLCFKQPVPGADKIVGWQQIVGGIGDDRTPSVQASPRLQGPHQSQLKSVSPMFAQHPNPTKIPALQTWVEGITPANATASTS